jgi:hypothetical protein
MPIVLLPMLVTIQPNTVNSRVCNLYIYGEYFVI